MVRLSSKKKALFGLLTCVSILILLELCLALVGAPTLLERQDPYRGFSRNVPVFEQHGDRYQTARRDGPRTFNEQSFLAKKPAGGLRLFCLGGSSAYGYPWNADVAFTAIVGDVLAAELPDRKIEAVNAAGVSYASHRLRIVAHEILDYDPDILVIYSGHNEFIERQFKAELEKQGAGLRDVSSFFGRSRLFGLLHGLRRREDEASSLARFRAFVRRDQMQTYSESSKVRIVSEAAESFRALVRAAKARGVKVVVCTVPCNWKDWAPNGSHPPEGLSPDAWSTWSASLERGRALLSEGDSAGARQALERAVEKAPGHAETRYLLGRAQLGEQAWEPARASLIQACDLDASPIRRVSAINEGLRSLAKAEGVLLVDVDRAFDAQSEHALVGMNLLEDYVHPTRDAHRQIAWQLLEALGSSGWIEGFQAPSKERFEEVLSARKTQGAERSSTWLFNQGYLLEHRGLMSQAITMYREALSVSPTHSGALANLSHLLTKQGAVKEALSYAERLCRQDPENPQGHLALANALARLGNLDAAATHYEEATRLSPPLVAAWVNLGLVRLRQNDESAARSALETALAHDPKQFVALIELGAIQARASQFAQAGSHYREALEIRPRSAVAHCRLGLVTLAEGDQQRGQSLLERAKELAKKPIDPRSEVGETLLRLGLTLE